MNYEIPNEEVVLTTPPDKNWMDDQFIPGLVSVIIPTHNRGFLLPDTLESIAAQRYRPIEIIIVDDGSTDATKEFVDTFRANHVEGNSLFVHYKWQQKQGGSVARNAGLSLSRGEYIQFLDSDDILHKDKFFKQLAVLNKRHLDFVWSSQVTFKDVLLWNAIPSHRHFDGNRVGLDAVRGFARRTFWKLGLKEIFWKHALNPGAIKKNRASDDFIISFIQRALWSNCAGIYRRSACIQTGPWKQIPIFQDWEYHIRMLSWSPKIQFSPGILSAVRMHAFESITNTFYTKAGLMNALQSIHLVENEFAGKYSKHRNWRTVFLNQYNSIADIAQSLKLNDVADQANWHLSKVNA